MRARYYDPVIGRFVSEDGVWGNSSDPLSLNLYTYCLNSLIMLVDSNGNTPYMVTEEYDAKKTYNYFVTTRGMDFQRILFGLMPLNTITNDVLLSVFGGFNEIEDNMLMKSLGYSADILINLDKINHLFNGKTASAIKGVSKFAGYVGTGLAIKDGIEYFTKDSWKVDQLVWEIGATYLTSTTKERMLQKYAYLRSEIVKLLDSKELSYERGGVFGSGNIVSYTLNKEIEKNLILALVSIDVSRVAAGKEYKDIYIYSYCYVDDIYGIDYHKILKAVQQ